MMNKPLILITDDDNRIRELLCRYLNEHDFETKSAEDAFAAEKLLATEAFDLMVLDVMMPEKSGFTFAQELRKNGNETPIIFLTAKTEIGDKLKGFDYGADDYLTKPFEPQELIMRIHAILRRKAPVSEKLEFGNYVLDDKNMILFDGEGRKTFLNNIETNFLKVLIKANGKPVSRDELLSHSRLMVEFRTIDVQIMRLRQKIERDPKNPKYLKTVRGKGYLLEKEVQDNEK